MESSHFEGVVVTSNIGREEVERWTLRTMQYLRDHPDTIDWEGGSEGQSCNGMGFDELDDDIGDSASNVYVSNERDEDARRRAQSASHANWELLEATRKLREIAQIRHEERQMMLKIKEIEFQTVQWQRFRTEQQIRYELLVKERLIFERDRDLQMARMQLQIAQEITKQEEAKAERARAETDMQRSLLYCSFATVMNATVSPFSAQVPGVPLAITGGGVAHGQTQGHIEQWTG